jgi:hypothetical protein
MTEAEKAVIDLARALLAHYDRTRVENGEGTVSIIHLAQLRTALELLALQLTA